MDQQTKSYTSSSKYTINNITYFVEEMEIDSFEDDDEIADNSKEC